MRRLLAPAVAGLLLGQCADPQCAPDPDSVSVEVTPGDCDSYVPLFEEYGLPADTFKRVAFRESGCDHRRFTDDHDDLGGFLLGLNFRTQQLRNGWRSWCGATVQNARFDPELQVRCAAEAYARLGMRPWR